MSALPQVPSGFGMAGSPYPPHPNSTNQSRSTTPRPSHPSSTFASPPPHTPPKLPHLPQEARQQELQWRQQNGYPAPRSVSSNHPSQSSSSSSFSPGQLVTPQFSPAPRAASYNFTSAGAALSPAPYAAGPGFRAPSPGLPPSSQYGPSIQRAASAAPPQSHYPPPQHQSYPQRHSEIITPPQHYQQYQLQPPVQQARRASAAPAVPMPSATPVPPPHRAPSRMANDTPTGSGPPPLAKPMTDMAALTDRRERALASGEERVKLNWAKLVVKFVEREHGDAMSLKDPTLIRYVDEAMAVINRRANANPPDLDALFIRGELRASGNFPSYHRKDPKNAFNDFEYSGRMGYPPAWFRIGRDYETLNDVSRGRDAYERGRGFQDVGCIYRLGMAHLLGQLNVKQDYSIAMSLLREAADLANDETPQPAYIYGMLFAGEFAHLNIPSSLLVPPPDPANPHRPPSSERTAMRYIERSAYLNFAPAQYKLGWAYEYAQLDAAFDPLLSVQYYSLASKGGEVEADMAVSKWFLCGADGCFDKNEDLAYTFAEKAARKGLPTAEFALAYYSEVGVGCAKNISAAKKWYKKAAAHGNEDAKDRLEALQSESGSDAGGGEGGGALTRTQYEAQLESRLTRKHTAAKNRSLKEGRGSRKDDQRTHVDGVANGLSKMSVSHEAPPPPSPQVSRQKTLKMVNEAAHESQRRASATPLPVPSTPSRALSPAPAASFSTSPSQGGMSMPMSMPMPHPQPYAPQSGPSTPAGSAIRSRMPSSGGGPSGYPSSPTAAAAAAPPARPRPSNGPMHPGLNGHSQGASTSSDVSSGGHATSAASSSSSAATAAPSSSSVSTARKYNTFAEMGFESKAGKDDKDCVVM